jgi:diadenosine tetraphosphate (Ap4A) HIT family hydrolase
MRGKKIINLKHARTTFQKKVMERIARDNVCPFCQEHFLKYHTKPIITEGQYWLLTENFQPYKGSKHHILLVSKKHVTHFNQLKSGAFLELFLLLEKELKKRKIDGGTILMRFGNTDYTGGTVEHLHAQLVSGQKRSSKRELILTLIGYGNLKSTSTSPK